ncbi:DUF305 domain-containing protein [Actinomadura rudentiformis]|uniref:DUF305 domain-containing protein n=1 Tax=Actinomadura rudentiformis TaxID=359158 RepID=A0A6H9YA16_9ACTN|nr:DUF305 domain-containing protein [Actinomadura rudentiformis]KAB2339647.1 DUF305 domain-containing protein [Actinomadura rudentiformis]
MKRGLKRIAICVALALPPGALLLNSCGDHTPPGTFNSADVMFLQMMVPHHGQGVRIARLARDRAARPDVRPDVRTLAAAIETTQISEIRSMAGWLRSWRRPPTAPAGSHSAHGGMPMTSEAAIEHLGKTTGAAFERDFLNMLIAHQDDALQMARREVAAGTNPEAKGLADRVARSRAAQIDQMLTLLRR